MPKYVEYTEEEFRKFIEYRDRLTQKVRSKWEEISIEGCWEYVWRFPIEKHIEIRIYSSIYKRENKTRPNGKDAVRIHIYHTNGGGIIKSASRTHRTLNMFNNIKQKTLELHKWWKQKSLKCEQCNEYLIPKESRNGDIFWGCVIYPKCTHTLNYHKAQLYLKGYVQNEIITFKNRNK